MLGRFAKPSVGIPRDARTVAIIAAGGAVGLWAGGSAGRGLVDAVREAFDGIIDGDNYRPRFIADGRAWPDVYVHEDWGERANGDGGE